MVSIKEIRAANSSNATKSLTAVFAGATSGIGLAAIESLLKNTASSKVYIIGRSKSKFAPTLEHLQGLNKTSQLIFIEAQVSLLKEVSRVCHLISSQESSIDILWLSQGGLDSSAHSLSPESLFKDYAITYYSRTLFMHTLLPLLRAKPTNRDSRIISILAAGEEGPLASGLSSDPGIVNPQNYPGFWAAQKQGVTMMSLAMSQLASENPDVSFIHTMPGMVATNVHNRWAETFENRWLGWLMGWVVVPLMHLLAITPERAGEVGFYEITDQRFRAVTGGKGENLFRLWDDAEDVGSRGRETLLKYESEGAGMKLWEHTLGVFEKVLRS